MFSSSDKLEHCDSLFKKYLRPWYPGKEKPTMTRPDMYVISSYKGKPLDLDEIQYLNHENLWQTKEQIKIMTDAAVSDYRHICDSNALDLKVLDAVDKHFNMERVIHLIKESDPKDFGSPYVVSVCEFGAMLGHLFIQDPGFGWLYSHPYFHSIVVHKQTGYGITVFDWAVKKFSSYGIDDGFVAKYHAAIEAVKNSNR